MDATLTVCQSITVLPQKNRLRVYIDGPDKYYRLRELRRALPDVVVKGVTTIQRAIINIKEKDDHRGKKGDKELLVEGYGLQKVMTTQGVVGEFTSSNHVIETAQVLGIEAARRTIINEIQFTMQSHGMSIDPRHVMLLGDVMSYKVCLASLGISSYVMIERTCFRVGRGVGHYSIRRGKNERQCTDASFLREDYRPSFRCFRLWED